MRGSYRTPIVKSEAHRLAKAREQAEVQKQRDARRKKRLRLRTKQEKEWLAEERLRYQIAWESYRRRERVAAGLFLVVGLAPPLAAARVPWDHNLAPHAAVLPGIAIYIACVVAIAIGSLTVGWLLSVTAAELGMRSFRCPRCERQYQPSRHDAPRCRHCGLPYGAVDGR